MVEKFKQKPKDVTWRDYRRLILWIALWLGFAQFILAFDPIMFNTWRFYEAHPDFAQYEVYIEFAISTALVSFWMPIAYRYGRKWGFSRKWMLICIVASLIATLMLTLEQRHPLYPLDCVYKPLGDLLVRTQLYCPPIFYNVLF